MGCIWLGCQEIRGSGTTDEYCSSIKESVNGAQTRGKG
jgi:hypothetical protein